MTVVDAGNEYLLQRAYFFTKSEIRQISMVCMKALKREEKEKRNDRE